MLRHAAVRSVAAAVAYGVPLLAIYAVTGPLRTQIAAVAVWLCGLAATEHLMRFTAAPGWIQGTALAFFALFPWLWWRRDSVNAFAISLALPQLRR